MPHLLSKIERIASLSLCQLSWKHRFVYCLHSFWFVCEKTMSVSAFYYNALTHMNRLIMMIESWMKRETANSSICSDKQIFGVKILTPCKLQHFTIETAASMHIKSIEDWRWRFFYEIMHHSAWILVWRSCDAKARSVLSGKSLICNKNKKENFFSNART